MTEDDRDLDILHAKTFNEKFRSGCADVPGDWGATFTWALVAFIGVFRERGEVEPKSNR
jgi:hypothetical protein